MKTKNSGKQSSKNSSAQGSSKPRKESTLERRFKLLWFAVSGQELEQEYRFHPTRKWRADFAHVGAKVLIECEGGIWSGGRHTRGGGYIGDLEKYNEAVVGGWAVIRLSGSQITTDNLEKIKVLIAQRCYL